MINEKKLVKVKKKMARKRARYAIERVFLNPKRILSWIYWIVILGIFATSHFLLGKDILLSFGRSILGPIIAFVIIFFMEYNLRKRDIDIEERYERNW